MKISYKGRMEELRVEVGVKGNFKNKIGEE